MSTTHQTYLANTAADESVPAPYQQLHRIPEPGYTAGAVEAMDAGDPKPSAGYCDGYSAGWADALGGPPPISSPWRAVAFGLLCGVAGYVLAVML